MSDSFESTRILIIKSVLQAKPETYHVNPLELEELVRTEKFKSYDKINRHALMQSKNIDRPKKELGEYAFFNGLQPLDVDFKNEETAQLAKQYLQKFLFKYKWVRSISMSTSGNGLHIYTYHRPKHQSIDVTVDELRTQYLCTYEYKSIILWKSLILTYGELQKIPNASMQAIRDCHPLLNTSTITEKRPKPNVVDSSLAQISQAMFITADTEISINPDFQYDDLYVTEQDISDIYELDVKTDNYYKLDNLKQKFDSLFNRTTELSDGSDIDLNNVHIHKFGSAETIQPQNYDNFQRYRMAYTLCNLHNIKPGSPAYNQIESLFLLMCSGNPKYSKEKSAWKSVFSSAAQRFQAGTAPIVYSSIRDLKQLHGYDIEIENYKQLSNNEIIAEHNTDDKIKKFLLSDVEIDPMFKLPITSNIELKQNEFIGTYTTELLDSFKLGINYIWARPGLGKTEFIKSLTKRGLKVILVLPFTSIITSKIEKSDLKMHCIYGDRKVDLVSHNNICMTYDKFCNIDIDEASMIFDYIAVDESHLLTCSQYRGLVPANTLDVAKRLRTKVVFMSGTPIAEHMFTPFVSMTHITKPELRDKVQHFIMTNNSHEKITKIGKHAAEHILSGGKILFPTNSGNEYTQRILGAIKAFLGRKPKHAYYKKEHDFFAFMDKINSDGTIGDLDILFCSNYLSVGIDINDTKHKFDIIYDEKFTAQEIEQFNCRLRKVDLRSFLYFDKFYVNGEPKNLTVYENLDMTITNEQQLEFGDVFRLHTNNDNPQSYYDFFRWAFRQPYFIQDNATNTVTLHETAYKLFMFEDRWRSWSLQLNVISSVLKNQLGYRINYIDSVNDLSDIEIGMAVDAARMESKLYRAQKQQHIEQMLNLIEDQASFDSLIFIPKQDIVNSDKWAFVMKKNDSGDRLTLLVGNRKIYDDLSHKLRHLSKYYTYDVILAIIYERCTTPSGLKMSRLNHIVSSIIFFANAKNKKLVKSNTLIMKHIFENVFESNVEVYVSKTELEQLKETILELYIKTENTTAQSVLFRNRFTSKIEQFWHHLTEYQGDDVWRLIRLPRFNTVWAKSTQSIQQIFAMMFDDDIFSSSTQALIDANEISRRVNMDVFDGHDEEETISSNVILKHDKATFDTSELEEYNEELDSVFYKERLLIEAESVKAEPDEQEIEDIQNINLEGIDLNKLLGDLNLGI